MTKKDYELIAGVLETNLVATLAHPESREKELAIELINSFANDLALDNPRFDRNKFLQACGIEKPDIFSKGYDPSKDLEHLDF